MKKEESKIVLAFENSEGQDEYELSLSREGANTLIATIRKLLKQLESSDES